MNDDESDPWEPTIEEIAEAERLWVEFLACMPPELRQEIESLLAAGWMWKEHGLTNPEDDDDWIYINPMTFEKAYSIKRAWEINEANGRGWWTYES